MDPLRTPTAPQMHPERVTVLQGITMVSCTRALYHAGAAKSHQLQWRGGVGGFPDDDLLCPRYNVPSGKLT